MSSEIAIRNSLDADIPSITAIYTREVRSGLASFEIEPPGADEIAKRRASLIGDGYPYLVACIESRVVGYAYVGPYRSREAYQHTLENSVYVSPTSRRAGVGKKLLSALIDSCSQGPWHTIIAVIGDSKNKASIELHTALGFIHAGTLKEVGFKHDRWVDSVLMQKLL